MVWFAVIFFYMSLSLLASCHCRRVCAFCICSSLLCVCDAQLCWMMFVSLNPHPPFYHNRLAATAMQYRLLAMLSLLLCLLSSVPQPLCVDYNYIRLPPLIPFVSFHSYDILLSSLLRFPFLLLFPPLKFARIELN